MLCPISEPHFSSDNEDEVSPSGSHESSDPLNASATEQVSEELESTCAQADTAQTPPEDAASKV